MAIQWGAWEYGGGNGMRVGIEVSATSVRHGTDSCTVTFEVYTQNQYNYNDDQSLNIGGTGSWSNVGYNNGGGSGSSTRRTTKTYKYNFDSNDYGGGTAKTVTLSATVNGAYNGVTPSKSVSFNIPKRPIAAPAAPTSVNATRNSDTSATVTWTRHDSNGEPWDKIDAQRWDNVSNTYVNLANLGGGASSANWGIGGNRRWRFRVRAGNSAGWSGWGYSDYIQTSPASPAGCSVAKSSVTSALISWRNGASSSGYSYDTLLDEQVNGGAWNTIAVLPAGTASYNRTGLNPGSVYAYRVVHRSTLGGTTYSGYSTSGGIQLQSPPAAPTVVSTVRDNDNSFTLNWANNPNGSVAPYDGLTVQRKDGETGAWQTIATLIGSAVSMADTSTVVNHVYQWRIAASNAAGVSGWAYFDTYQTRPAEPDEVSVKAAPGGAMQASWVNTVGYNSYSIGLRYYKNDVFVDDTIVLAAGETTYLLEGVDLTATYKFGVRAISNVGYASASEWVETGSIAAATVPDAPGNLAPNGAVQDLNTDTVFTWTHNPSIDGASQTGFEIQYSLDGGTTWTSSGAITSTESTWTMPAGTLPNGADVTWIVRTWGVHADPSAYSASAVFPTSTTPTATINQPGGVLTTSTLEVVWSYNDYEAAPQARWEVELYDHLNALMEAQNGEGETTGTTMTSVIVDGSTYLLRVRLQDGDGLWSAWTEQYLTAAFTPPAVPLLDATYSQEAGVAVITLTPTVVEEGVTLPPIGVDLQRRLLQPETDTWGEWETLAEGMAADATVIDTTAPIANDGEYRIITYSAAPSAKVSEPQPPAGYDDRWVYLSGGPNFRQVCRLMGNVALRTTTTRERSLYNFAGRQKPVMFAGEARGRVIDVAGLLDGESSSPAEWEHLIANSEVLLFRDPLGHRVYGSVPQVAIDNLGNEMYAVSFTVTEVSYP